MPDAFEIEVVGLDKLLKAFEKFPRVIRRSIEAAGEEAADEILDTEGLRDYPNETAANQPPMPYYIRGRGTQYASGRNLGESERLGSQWTIKARGYKTAIGNRASYARWVHGKEQARAMDRIGWRKLWDVAKKKKAAITKIYQGWVNRTLRRLNLL